MYPKSDYHQFDRAPAVAILGSSASFTSVSDDAFSDISAWLESTLCSTVATLVYYSFRREENAFTNDFNAFSKIDVSSALWVVVKPSLTESSSIVAMVSLPSDYL